MRQIYWILTTGFTNFEILRLVVVLTSFLLTLVQKAYIFISCAKVDRKVKVIPNWNQTQDQNQIYLDFYNESFSEGIFKNSKIKALLVKTYTKSIQNVLKWMSTRNEYLEGNSAKINTFVFFFSKYKIFIKNGIVTWS